MGYLVYFVFVFVFPDKVSLCSPVAVLELAL